MVSTPLALIAKLTTVTDRLHQVCSRRVPEQMAKSKCSYLSLFIDLIGTLQASTSRSAFFECPQCRYKYRSAYNNPPYCTPTQPPLALPEHRSSVSPPQRSSYLSSPSSFLPSSFSPLHSPPPSFYIGLTTLQRSTHPFPISFGTLLPQPAT
jgi:hypothetical protein